MHSLCQWKHEAHNKAGHRRSQTGGQKVTCVNAVAGSAAVETGSLGGRVGNRQDDIADCDLAVARHIAAGCYRRNNDEASTNRVLLVADLEDDAQGLRQNHDDLLARALVEVLYHQLLLRSRRVEALPVTSSR